MAIADREGNVVVLESERNDDKKDGITLQPFCLTCGKISNLWIGKDNLLRYVCPDNCNPFTEAIDIVHFIQITNEGMYVNHCWNCGNGIDSRLPLICKRDENRQDLFCCSRCGESMKNFPGARPITETPIV